MKWLIFTLVLTISFPASSVDQSSDEEICWTFLQIKDSYKTAHENESCLRAAQSGVHSAQYSVGMAYGIAGKPELEKKYYRLAANGLNIAAYLALGHVLREENVWETIYWYQRYIATKAEGYGYAALLLSKIFNDLDDEVQANYWLAVCESSTYKGCKNE